MTSANPPYPYFNGITYNSQYFASSGSGLTQSQANALYLKKNTADTASALETFSGGIVSDSYDSSTSSATTTIGASNLTGNINIGNGNRTAGNINIGTGTFSASTTAISIGTALTTTNLQGPTSVYSLNAMTSGLMANVLNLGNANSTTSVNLGTNANVATISIGTVGTTTTINGPLTLTQPPSFNYTTLPTLTTSQQGYIYGGDFSGTTMTSPTKVLSSFQVLKAGNYVFTFLLDNNFSGYSVAIYLKIYSGATSGATTTALTSRFGFANVTTSAPNVISMNGSDILTLTANTYYTLALSFDATYVSSSYSGSFKAIRIG